MFELRKPSMEELPGYRAALERGWSADTMRAAAAEEELQKLLADPDAFLTSMDDREARGGPIPMPDGSTIPRLPGFRRWIWDGEFCGSIGLRWQAGTSELPPYVPGHIGYAIVPWKRNFGYATRALALLLPDARDIGLDHVELTTHPDNVASQRVMVANGATLAGSFPMAEAYGGGDHLLFRIDL